MTSLPRRYRPRSVIVNSLIYTLLAVLSFLWIVPLIWLLLNAFRAEPGAYTTYILPRGYTLNNFVRLFTETGQFNYPRWFLNTLIVAVCSCTLSTLYILMISHAFSRLRFMSRTLMMNVFLVLGMFPGFMSMIAVYHILNALGLGQSLAALILVYSSTATTSYYITKGFFDTIPRSLDEAACIDGATQGQILWKIILPLSKPIITYTVLITFIAPWADFIFASVIMKDNYNQFTIAVGLFRMLERENLHQYFTRFCAGAVLVAIPITLLFVKMQRYYVDGVTGGSVKG